MTARDGANGIDGKDGTNGVDGKDGTNGADGKDGVNGTNGKDGADGKTVEVQKDRFAYTAGRMRVRNGKTSLLSPTSKALRDVTGEKRGERQNA